MDNKPKILLLDIETSPSIGFFWSRMWETDIIETIKDWQILSFAYKWLDEKSAHVKGQIDYKGYGKNIDDRKICEDLFKLLDSADIVVAHNGDNFDLKKINTRLVYYKSFPPSPYKTIDTKKVASQNFGFNSNRLNDLGVFLGLGKKLEHKGFPLWKECMSGVKRSWNLMKEYNKQDIVLLEKVYQRFLPWIKTHPNYGMYTGKISCPRCGSTKLQSRGYQVNITTKYKRVQCQDCGGWSRVNKGEKLEVRPMVSI